MGWGTGLIWWDRLEIQERHWRSWPWLGVPAQNPQYMTERVRLVTAPSDDRIGTSGREACITDWADYYSDILYQRVVPAFNSGSRFAWLPCYMTLECS